MHEKRFEGNIERLRSPERVERLEVERVIDLCMEKGRFENVLDVGTGSGLFAEAFAAHALSVSGVDVNGEMLVAARGFVPDADFREGTAEALPFPDSSFDLVFLGLVLHESDDVLKTLREAFRVARKEVCILEWPYRDQSFGPPLAHRLNPRDLPGLFNKAGFRKWMMLDLANTCLYCLEV
jgi:ubiquinone/menaquinone biosynthesis C-methylase UbiE